MKFVRMQFCKDVIRCESKEAKEEGIDFVKDAIGKEAKEREIDCLRKEDGVHCVVTEQTDTYIGGEYMVEVMRNQIQYNIETGSFETMPVAQVRILRFDLFPSERLVMLWGEEDRSKMNQ